MSTNNIQKTIRHLLIGCVLSAVAFNGCTQSTYTGKLPTPVAGEPALANAEIKTRYQNCELGFYHGARPGKVRYVKDSYIWAVTPEFAKKFCMPKEFVSHELKGAEAVAFKLMPGGFGENCGFGGKAEVCAQGVDLRFEIYISRDVKLPVKNEVDFYYGRMHRYDSYSLIGHSDGTAQMGRDRWKNNPTLGAIPRFETNAFGLAGIQGDKVVWSLTTLYLDEYRGKLYDGTIAVYNTVDHMNAGELPGDLGTATSALGFLNALEHGNTGSAVVSGISLANNLGEDFASNDSLIRSVA